MAAGLDADIRQFNVESLPELQLLNQVALERGRRARVALRINPDVDARTHASISTGKAENKFGIELGQARAAYAEAARLPGIEVDGLAVHIGSQLTEIEPYRIGLRQDGGAGERIAAGRHAIRETRPRRRPRHRLCATRRRRRSPITPRPCKATVGDLGLPLIFEPGAAHRRQCRHPASPASST